MNVAIIIGHDQSNKGAISYASVYEYDYNSLIGELLLLQHKYKKKHGLSKINKFLVFDRNNGWSHISKELKENKIDISLELHFNAYSKKAYGTETLALANDVLSKEHARHLSVEISNLLNTRLRRDRGVKEIIPGDRGYYNLNFAKKSGVKTVMLVEPCFASFQTPEAEKLMNEPLAYAQCLYNTIESWVV